MPSSSVENGRRIQLPCGELAFSTTGSGPVLMLVHGLGESRHTWRHMIGPLAQYNTVIAVDLPGHGESPAPSGDYSVGAYASALRDLLLALGHRRASVMGHSLGGSIALQFAYQFPERTERLLLLSSGGLGKEVTLALRAVALPGVETAVLVAEQLTKTVSRARRLLPFRLVQQGAARGTDRLVSFVRVTRSVINWQGQRVNPPHQAELLNALPVFLAWGDDDTTIPPAHHQDLANSLENAHVLEIPGAGHFPQETTPEVLCAAVHEFLHASAPSRYTDQRWRQRLWNGVGSRYLVRR